jgi:NitT/TauT family transport system substrate-binding protein
MTKIRLRLNGDFTGPHAWFFLALERGYFRDGGLELELLPGDGAAAIVPGIGHDGVEAGYGDLCALASLASRNPDAAPVGVFQVFNRVPFTIAVRAGGPIRVAADLPGCRLIGKADDAAMLLFPALADAAGFDCASVQVAESSLPMGQQVRDALMTGAVDGVFGFVNTIIAAATPLGVDARSLHFIEYADELADLYGNGLMVSRRLLREAPLAVRALVLGLSQGVRDTVADIDAAMAALSRAAPTIDVAVQRRRLLGTMQMEMSHPEGARIGIGDVDDDRLGRGLGQAARSCGWPSTPKADQVFSRAFLPPLHDRVRTLAR